MAARGKKDALFFKIRDSPFSQAERLITGSTLATLNTRYKPRDQTTLFFAAARQSGQDTQALALCRMLLERGVPVNHADELGQTALFYAARQGHTGAIKYLLRKGADPNLIDQDGETAIFYAVSKRRVDAIKALLDGGANLEVVNKRQHTCMSLSPSEILPTLAEERKKRRRYEDLGPAPKRQRSPVQELRQWANEWPIKERVVAQKIDYKDEDVVLQSSDGYAVVKNAPGICAARLRVSEKHFVVDHAELLESESWVKELTPEDWCKTVGVITDEAGDSVRGIETVVSGRNPHHFTLPLVEKESKEIAGYVHATYTPEKKEMGIAHVKVDSKHMGKGLGGLLIDAAENHSHDIGWTCKKTYLSVLKANVRAQRCYSKAGFKFESSHKALWGSKQHPASEWQRWRKVHKHHFAKNGKKCEKQ
eukprot:Skav214771  [mRNA]  locus=scaffold3923:11631:12896:+ [translate_table: standard]